MEVLSNTSRSYLMAALFMIGAPAANAQEQTATTPIPLLTEAKRSQLESLLNIELQRIADQKEHFDDQKGRIHVNSHLDPVTEKLVIDLGEEYGPISTSAQMEDLQGLLDNAAIELLQNVVQLKGLEFRYGGKDLYHYFPEQWQAPRPAPSRRSASVFSTGASVVISAGHGIYFHHGFNDWRPQRDPTNGIVEDFITPEYARELARWFRERNGADTSFPRAEAILAHDSSGEPWWQLGARYNLKNILPDNIEIWHSLPGDQGSNRERNEDIVSRPLYANHLGADAVFHLHTNAAEPTASGTRLFYHEGRDNDKRLAENVLCYMKEIIQAQGPYEKYNVPSQAISRSNLGENREAKMPSVIVESGFHTNASDAVALQDPVFRTAAMKGVEKGYRLHGEGKGCEPLMVSETPDAGGPFGTFVPMEVYYEGHPQFPVTVKVDIASCPIDSTCNGGSVVFSEKVASPLRYAFECRGTSNTPATARLRTTLIDVDEVKAVSTEHELTCTPARRSAPDLAPVDTSRPSLTVGAS